MYPEAFAFGEQGGAETDPNTAYDEARANALTAKPSDVKDWHSSVTYFFPACLATDDDATCVLEEAHVHGTYTTRWNVAFTKDLAKYREQKTSFAVGQEWDALKQRINEKVTAPRN